MNLNKQIRAAMKIESGNTSDQKATYGTYLNEEDFENFSEYQLNQLLTLAQELHGDVRFDSSKSRPLT